MGMLNLVRHGRALRLNAPEGTYSYYHPQHVFTGLGWDAQSGSLLLAKKMDSILILGLGGGTVARQCRLLFPNSEIVGVEVNQKVISLAYRYFALSQTRVKVIDTAGEAYLRETKLQFDGIIDDMWLPYEVDRKPVLQDPAWGNLICSRLSPGGMYAVNLYSRSECRYQVSNAVRRLAGTFPTLREVRPGPGETTVVAGGLSLCSPREARIKLRSLPPGLAAALAHLSFRTVI